MTDRVLNMILHCMQKQSFADVFPSKCSYKFRKFYRKTLLLESLFDKVASFQAYSFYWEETPAQAFYCEIYKIFKNTFLSEHIWWLHLSMITKSLKAITEINKTDTLWKQLTLLEELNM